MRVYKRSDSEIMWIDFWIGKRRFREASGVTDRAEAQAVLARRMTEERSRAAVPARDLPSLASCHATWAGTLPENPRRSRDDRKRAGAFVKWFGGDRSTADVSTVDVTRWIKHLQDSQGLSPATLKRHKTSLSTMFRWARAFGHAPGNPVEGAHSPPVSRRRKPPYALDVVRQTFEAVKGTVLEPVFRLAFYAGMRREEVARACWEDVDFKKGVILVRGTKTESSLNEVALHRDLRSWLEANRRPSGPIAANRFGQPYHATSLENLRRDKLRTLPWLPNFHRMRHTLASVLFNSGASIENVSKVMRHSSTKTTQEHYVTGDAESTRSDLEKLVI